MEIYLVCKDNAKFEETGKLIKAAEELGLRVRDTPCDVRCPFFLYGTRDFVLQYVDNQLHIFSEQEYMYDYSFLMSITEPNETFNYDAKIIPASNYCNFNINTSYFVRPNSGNKQFTGQVINSNLRKRYGFYLNRYLSIYPWELVVVSSEKTPPKEEYRFFCYLTNNNSIKIECCRYLPEETNDVPELLIGYAKSFAKLIFDNIPFGNSFVLDMAYDPPEYKASAIELNSWNSSSFYSIDPKKLLEIILNDR